MTPAQHKPPQSHVDWVALADRELANLSGAYHGKLTNDAKIEHALKATEAMLKAIIWKKNRWNAWPERAGKYKFLYNHNYEVLLDHCGDSARSLLKMDDERWASWQALCNAALKQHRYSPENPSDAETNAVARAARYPDWGIVPWLKKLYRDTP